jgi:L-alanine-DL-glutamate epimerase-like enolase superfamily enzyme
MCVAMGIAMTIEDSGGGDIVTAAIAHLAHSTPEKLRFNVSDCNSYVTLELADGAPRREDGRFRAPAGPGLGIAVRSAVLGKPVLTVG